MIQNPNSGFGFENGLIFTDSSESEGRSFNFISSYTYKIPSSRFIYSRNKSVFRNHWHTSQICYRWEPINLLGSRDHPSRETKSFCYRYPASEVIFLKVGRSMNVIFSLKSISGPCQNAVECPYHWLEIDLGREEHIYAVSLRSNQECLSDRCRLVYHSKM